MTKETKGISHPGTTPQAAGGVGLDTSGGVLTPEGWVTWNRHLSPFEQGYVEALFASGRVPDRANLKHSGVYMHDGCGSRRAVGFSDLAPEALAAIRKDCRDYRRLFQMVPYTAERGRVLWQYRQARDPNYADYFPPLTVTLGEDGKVRVSPVDGTARSPQPIREEPVSNPQTQIPGDIQNET